MTNIKFYNCTDDPRKISKTVGNLVHEANAAILSSCSIMHPVFLLTYHSSLVSANYMLVSDWGRYYYITDVILSPGARCTVTGKEDVLMSNAGDILSLTGYCSRCESNKTRLMVDASVPSLVTTNVTTLNFDKTPFSGLQYLLTVKGGKITGGD